MTTSEHVLVWGSLTVVLAIVADAVWMAQPSWHDLAVGTLEFLYGYTFWCIVASHRSLRAKQ